MRKVLLLAAAIGAWVSPAPAYHEGTLRARVSYCTAIAYAYVESLVTYRTGIETALESVQATPLGADGARTVDVVQRVTAAGVTRAAEYLDDCLAELEGPARPDAEAAAGEALRVELDFAIGELDQLRDALRTQEADLRTRLGERLAPTASTLLSEYRAFVAKLEVEMTALKKRADDVIRRMER